MTDTLPRIALFTLGGTIASIPSRAGRAAVPKLDAEDLLAAIPQIAQTANIDAITFSQNASGDLTVAQIYDLAAAIKQAFADGAAGAVITQGTDTLEETSYLLDLLTDQRGPIVLTGAMRNPGLAGHDGPANLLAAIQVAASPLASGIGPVVVFSDQIHLARYVRKTHSSFVDAFHSPNLGPVGWVTEGNVHLPLVPRHRTEHIALTPQQVGKLPPVALVKVGLGDDLSLLHDIDARGYRAVVLEAMGGGHLPSRTVAEVATLGARIPVVFVTRAGSGPVYSSTYGFPGSEKDLLDRGLIAGGVLDGSKARMLVQLLLARGVSNKDIAQRLSHEAM